MRDLYETFPLSTSRLSMAPTVSDYVEDVVLAADTLLRVSLPAGAQFVLFSLDSDFRAKLGTVASSFSLPTTASTDGSGSELNPAARRIPATLGDGTTVPTHLLLRAPGACKGSLSREVAMNGYFNTRSTLSSAGLATALPQQTAPVYFRKPANLRKWQAALAKLRAGTYRPKAVFVGDSKTVGTGAGTSSGNTWTDGAEPHSKIAHVVKLLTARGIPANRNAWFASSGLASVAARQAYDPRLSGMSGWSGGNQTLGGVMWATNGTTSFVFTPEGQVDTLVTFSKQRANDGTFTITADASPTVLSTVNGSPAGGSTVDGFIKTTTTITKASHYFNTQRTTGGYISLVGQLAYDSTVPAVDVINGGAFGTVSAYHASTNGTSVWNAANFLATLTPDLVVIQLGSNDLNTAVSVATYAANIQDIITRAKAAGADVVLEVASVGNTGGYGNDAEREAYRQALIALGSANDCMLVDHPARFVTYASVNGLGLMRDAIHETEAGYADEAAALVDALIL